MRPSLFFDGDSHLADQALWSHLSSGVSASILGRHSLRFSRCPSGLRWYQLDPRDETALYCERYLQRTHWTESILDNSEWPEADLVAGKSFSPSPDTHHGSDIFPLDRVYPVRHAQVRANPTHRPIGSPRRRWLCRPGRNYRPDLAFHHRFSQPVSHPAEISERSRHC